MPGDFIYIFFYVSALSKIGNATDYMQIDHICALALLYVLSPQHSLTHYENVSCFILYISILI